MIRSMLLDALSWRLSSLESTGVRRLERCAMDKNMHEDVGCCSTAANEDAMRVHDLGT